MTEELARMKEKDRFRCFRKASVTPGRLAHIRNFT